MPYKDPLNRYLNRKQHYKKIRSKQAEYLKMYVKKNKDAIALRKKLWELARRERLTEEDKIKRRSAVRRWRDKNVVRVNAYMKRYRKEHAAQLKIANKKHQLRRKYGLTTDQFTKLLESQKHKCALCFRVFGTERYADTPHVDHCHDSKRVRGLLCHLCNRGLGLFKDDAAILRRAVRYLLASPSPLAS